MEKYVTSRKLSERLKNAGLPQETRNTWIELSSVGWTLLPAPLEETERIMVPGGECLQVVGAVMTDQLLEQLPDNLIVTKDKMDGSVVYYAGQGFTGKYRDDNGWHQSLPNALAELWLWCKEHGLLQAKTEGEE